MEPRIRKPNRLPGYNYTQNGAYFVTVCVKDRHEILSRVIRPTPVGGDAHIAPSPTDTKPEIKLLEYGIIADKYIRSIPGITKYVIMPNHIHMIIWIDNEPSHENGAMWASPPTKGGKPQSVSQLIKSFKTLVTKEIGAPIFQRSFHDHIIRDEQDYHAVWEYIDANPFLWQEDCFYPGTTPTDL